MEPSTLLLYVIILTTMANITLLFISKYVHLSDFRRRTKINVKEKMLKFKTIRNLVYDIAADLVPRYRNAGVEKGSEGLVEYIGDIVYYSIIFGTATLLSAALLALVFNNMFLIIFGVTGFLIILYPYLDYLLLKGERDKAIYNELAFFAFTSYIHQESGRNLDQCLQHASERNIFKWMKTESKIMLTDLLIHTQNLYTSLRTRASTTKATLYKRFLDGYAGLHATGGNLLSYLEHQIELLKSDFKARTSQYVEKALMISEINIILTVILPMIVLASSTTESTVGNIIQLATICFIVVYAFTVVLLADNIRPKTGTGNVRLKPKALEVTLSITSFITFYLLSSRLWLATAASIATFSLIYGRRGRNRLNETRQLEESLPNFIRDIADYKAAGKSIYQGMMLAIKEKAYNSKFLQILNKTANRFSLNASNISSETGVWLVDYVFDSVDLMQRTGGGNTATLMELANLIEDTEMEKERIRRETGLATYMTYLSPILFTIVTASILALSEIMSETASMQTPIFSIAISEIQKEWIYLTIVTATATNAFITKYVQQGSYEDTVTIAFTLLIASACILQMDSIIHLIRTFLGVR
ncbi:MAG: type II secretion system F family protein [Nitrososphaeria archaeon]